MTFSRATRKLALTFHVALSVGWLGAVAVFLVLGVVGVTSSDAATVRAVYVVARPITWYAIVPLSIASLVTGLISSLGTPWGLFRHYWVLFKLGLNLLATTVLLLYTQTVNYLADIAAASGDLSALRSPTFLLHSGGALVLLLIATVLGIYKPAGVTPYGRRRKQALRDATTVAA